MQPDSHNPIQSPKSSGAMPQSGNTNELASLGNRFLGALIDVAVIFPLLLIYTALVITGVISIEAANSLVFRGVSAVIGCGIFLLI